MARELVATCDEEEFNPVTTTDWRRKAPEQITACPSEEGEPIPRVTFATDVWAFAMTVVEVRVPTSISFFVHGNLTSNGS
jgi:hypothetical protein